VSDSGASRYPHLLSPLKVGQHTLRNRVVMGSMHTRLEQASRSLERRIAFYAARARGGAALIVTAGYAPNEEGRLEEDAQLLDRSEQLAEHRPVTAAVQAFGCKMLLQILHAGRYAKHDRLVGPSALSSPINPRTPRGMDEADIERTIEDFARTAELAIQAGYDGVEIMGSEGYLLTQFCASRSNQREDRWGGTLENRCRLAGEIVRRVRVRLGREPLLAYRISALDLVPGGLNGEETIYLARRVESAGADFLSTGIGWHESPVPTIAYHVPRGTWRFATAHLKAAVAIPVVASNRINTPDLAEEVLGRGEADLISLARPLLADPEFVAKAAAGRAAEINTCIACNQACLDYIFSERSASCLVNPHAGREIEWADDAARAVAPRRLAVVGAGPAGLAFAVQAAARGHAVVLFEAEADIGGQLNLARRIPGKNEFAELLRYFTVQLTRQGVELRLGTRASASRLRGEGVDHVIVATGSVPRRLEFGPIEASKTATYSEIILGRRDPGRRVAIIGTGGIAHDVAEFLTDSHPSDVRDSASAVRFLAEWGVDATLRASGGLKTPLRPRAAREVTLFQRSVARPGARLGISTGWILKSKLKARGVAALSGCEYLTIDARGLHYRIDHQLRLAEVETVIVCAGQEPERELPAQLAEAGLAFDIIGGARSASELDATRAILEGTSLARRI
jgi:2,4-dienoyl-CoA reductase (NADPH2)